MVEGALVFIALGLLLALRSLDKIESHLRGLQHIEQKRFEREIDRGDYDRN